MLTLSKLSNYSFSSWCNAIGLKAPGYYINVCYKHFSAGCPSRSCPNPDIVIPSPRQKQNNERVATSQPRNSEEQQISELPVSAMVKVTNNNINNNQGGTKDSLTTPTITLSKEKSSLPPGSLSKSSSDTDIKMPIPETVTRKLARHMKKKQSFSKQSKTLKASLNPIKVQKSNQSNVVITSAPLPPQQSQLSIQPNMITTTLIQQPSTTSPAAMPPSAAPAMPAQILSSLLLRGCNKSSNVNSGKIPSPISITLPTEPLPRSAASQHKISSDLKLRQCPAIVAVAPATPRTVLVSPSGVPTVTMVQANTPPVSPLTVVTVPNRTALPQKITLPQVPVPQSELVVQRPALHVSLQSTPRTVVPSLPTPPSSSVSGESIMSGSSEDSRTSSANNSIILSPVDDLNNLSSNTLLDFDVFESSIDCMGDISHSNSPIDHGEMISIKEEMDIEDKTLLMEDSNILKEEPIDIKEELPGALLDQSEDPCLNEGQNGNHFHQVQNLAGTAIQNNNNNNNNGVGGSLVTALNSTYLKCLSHIDMGNTGAITSSPFAADNMELDNVHRWLELCDAPSTTV